ncbi:hypothetical protein PF010_g26994 [Phytophthora fragariae]|uniref:Uncharacterized protein n=1 Tax=Phytophthora fragariae TaxID=53985 RepID=A0A6G0JVB0_9STRA|nr:hypothetical protein PF010_g26994 [Phytophthora fragariae]
MASITFQMPHLKPTDRRLAGACSACVACVFFNVTLNGSMMNKSLRQAKPSAPFSWLVASIVITPLA